MRLLLDISLLWGLICRIRRGLGVGVFTAMAMVIDMDKVMVGRWDLGRLVRLRLWRGRGGVVRVLGEVELNAWAKTFSMMTNDVFCDMGRDIDWEMWD